MPAASAGAGSPSRSPTESDPAARHFYPASIASIPHQHHHLSGRRKNANWLMRKGPQSGTVVGWLFGIYPQPTLGNKQSRLVNPESPFYLAVTAISVVLLLYVALIVQVEVGFFWRDDLCSGGLETEGFDLFVEVWFLLEIVLTFFTGVHKDGVYRDDLPSVAKSYVYSGAFFFDIITSFPETMVEKALRDEMCSDGVARTDTGAVSTSRVVQLVRPLRIFRIMRVTGIMRKMDHLDDTFNFQVLLDQLHIPTALSRIVKSILTIAFVIHTCAW
jgi:hypothetical protein